MDGKLWRRIRSGGEGLTKFYISFSIRNFQGVGRGGGGGWNRVLIIRIKQTLPSEPASNILESSRQLFRRYLTNKRLNWQNTAIEMCKSNKPRIVLYKI